MSWKIVCIDAFEAAQSVRAHPRSSISRAYYAAYAAAAYALAASKGVVFAMGRDGPGHNQIAELVGIHLAKKLGLGALKFVKAALRRLYYARLQADYKPHVLLGHRDVAEALMDARAVLFKLGILYG